MQRQQQHQRHTNSTLINKVAGKLYFAAITANWHLPSSVGDGRFFDRCERAFSRIRHFSAAPSTRARNMAHLNAYRSSRLTRLPSSFKRTHSAKLTVWANSSLSLVPCAFYPGLSPFGISDTINFYMKQTLIRCAVRFLCVVVAP